MVDNGDTQQQRSGPGIRITAALAAIALIVAGGAYWWIDGRSEPATDAALAECAVSPLPLLRRMTRVFVIDGDTSGRYVLGETQVDGESKNVLWDGDEVRVLDLPTSDGTLAKAVNSHGVIVGNRSAADLTSIGWVFRDETLTILPAPATGAFTTDVNNRGDILGGTTARERDGVGRNRRRALVWPAASPGTFIQLADPFPGVVGSYHGLVIAEDGSVVGTWEESDRSGEGPARAVRWDPTGQIVTLLPVPAEAGTAVRVYGASGDWAVGFGTGAAVLWNVRQSTATTLPDKFLPGMVSANGWVIGGSLETSFQEVKWRDGATQRLGSMPDSGNLEIVRAISDDGRLLAGNIEEMDFNDEEENPFGHVVAVRWTCG